mgnify:CR=1 FL=1
MIIKKGGLRMPTPTEEPTATKENEDGVEPTEMTAKKPMEVVRGDDISIKTTIGCICLNDDERTAAGRLWNSLTNDQRLNRMYECEDEDCDEYEAMMNGFMERFGGVDFADSTPNIVNLTPHDVHLYKTQLKSWVVLKNRGESYGDALQKDMDENNAVIPIEAKENVCHTLVKTFPCLKGSAPYRLEKTATIEGVLVMAPDDDADDYSVAFGVPGRQAKIQTAHPDRYDLLSPDGLLIAADENGSTKVVGCRGFTWSGL